MTSLCKWTIVLFPVYGTWTLILIHRILIDTAESWKGRTIRKVMGGGGVGGEVQKKYSWKGKSYKRNKCTPSSPKKHSFTGLKKLMRGNVKEKKRFWGLENSPPTSRHVPIALGTLSALLRIWSTISQFQHSWALSWLLSRSGATFKHFFGGTFFLQFSICLMQYFIFETFSLLAGYLSPDLSLKCTIILLAVGKVGSREKKNTLVFHF